ncbi:LGFP repeat-containing protein, partial [Microbacterium sp.]|uniref:LGFP repeat-containing protein n=1 Tax=Microbacterium sp. TaxID=51671 RepID=UPI002CE518CF|nr:lysozyme M1 [Microbacterium sp.]
SAGPYRANYLAAGGPSGPWGWPTGAAACRLAGGGCTMSFQAGVVAWSTATGSVLIPQILATEWTRRGATDSALGYPTAPATVSGTVTTQRFQNGTLAYDASTKTYS